MRWGRRRAQAVDDLGTSLERTGVPQEQTFIHKGCRQEGRGRSAMGIGDNRAAANRRCRGSCSCPERLTLGGPTATDRDRHLRPAPPRTVFLTPSLTGLSDARGGFSLRVGSSPGRSQLHLDRVNRPPGALDAKPGRDGKLTGRQIWPPGASALCPPPEVPCSTTSSDPARSSTAPGSPAAWPTSGSGTAASSPSGRSTSRRPPSSTPPGSWWRPGVDRPPHALRRAALLGPARPPPPTCTA